MSAVFAPLPSVSVANAISEILVILVPWKEPSIVNVTVTTCGAFVVTVGIGVTKLAIPSPSTSSQVGSLNVKPAGIYSAN